jgi:hypothetical protein
MMLKMRHALNVTLLMVCVFAPTLRAQVTVCDLAGPSEEIVIEAELLVGDSELALGALFCEENIYPSAPVAVSLVPAASLSDEDREALANAVAEARRIRNEGHTPRVLTVMSGQLDRRNDFRWEDYLDDEGGNLTLAAQGNGYGPNGMFWGQLTVESIENLEVEALPGPNELSVIPICDLAQDLQAWHGQRVAVRAQEVHSSEFGGIRGDCERGFVTDGLDWGASLDLTSPAWGLSDERIEAEFGIDVAATREAWERGGEAARGRLMIRTMATFIGTVWMHPEPFATCVNGMVQTYGYAHLGYAPAKFILEGVRDVTITDWDPAPVWERLDRCRPPDNEEVCLSLDLSSAESLPSAAETGCFDQVREILSGQGQDKETIFQALKSALWSNQTTVALTLFEELESLEGIPGDGMKEIDLLFKVVVRSVLETGDLSLLHALIRSGFDPNMEAYEGLRPLGEGIFFPELAQILLQAGADPNARNLKGQTVLMKASAYGQAETARLLIEYGADVNLTDENGFTALIHAVTGDDFVVGGAYTDAIPILLESRADPAVRNNTGQTALDIALETGNTWGVELLEAVTPNPR